MGGWGGFYGNSNNVFLISDLTLTFLASVKIANVIIGMKFYFLVFIDV